jgi:hypothetical protein
MSATTPLMDPIMFPPMSNSALAAFSPVLANGGRFSATQYPPQHYGPITDFLSAQLSQLGISNGPSSIVGTSDSTATPGQTPRPLQSFAATDVQFQHLQQHQPQQLFQPSQQQQQAAQLLYPPYYGVQYYLPTAVAAATANAYQQPFIVYNPADYYSLASQQLQQQQLTVAPNSQFGQVASAVGPIQPPQQQQITSLFAPSSHQPTSSASIPQFGPSYPTAPLNHPTTEQQHQMPPAMFGQVPSNNIGGGNNIHRPQQQQTLLTPVHSNTTSHIKQQQQPQHFTHHLQQQSHWTTPEHHQHSQSLPPSSTNVNTTCTKP